MILTIFIIKYILNTLIVSLFVCYCLKCLNNETNIKHGYSSMVHDAWGAILNLEAQISKAGAQFIYATRSAILKSGQGRNFGAPQPIVTS